jgi:hypothetical protein
LLLSKYVLSSCFIQLLFDISSNINYIYQLRALSEHHGQFVDSGGHFITYRRGVGTVDDHKWYRTNDAKVSDLSIK